MTKKMLIDATHPEETRVAVVSGTRLEEYDYETTVRKQLKSNIYLVKVTRVEPSLQAAFVDFGGNRHGFLPFPEIHPDYYRIPIADREALIAEERALAAAQAAKEDAEDAAELAKLGQSLEDIEAGINEDGGDEDEAIEAGGIEEVAVESYEPETFEPAPEAEITMAEAISVDQLLDDDNESAAEQTEGTETDGREAASNADSEDGDDEEENDRGGEDRAPFRSAIKRRYKIQEVIKRNQIMLIQISKEERGNKGAAVTSYISLPGRYCVLMPNSPRGGGVSRKVSHAKDRQRLKKILQELNVPEGMSVILRTAGVSRSIAEIKRDLDYLLRLWDQIRELTLKSTAPALIYEEGNLVKRAIRDLYRRDISEVIVSGEDGFKTARDFMRTLMPGHADRITQYTDEYAPLFARYQVEKQIDEIHSPTVHLKSGGYIVINPTEALVSIDVNSGKATKGRHIEETALKTNLEAADEIARQLRLRDQGGLVVIDFIDMEDKRANRIVEKRVRDAMQGDRARIQLGRISPFGLLELSRQRLNPSLVETNFEVCKHCNGTGMVRTVETTGVIVLRAIEEEANRARATEMRVQVPTDVAVYIFNYKRDMLAAIEKRHNVRVYLNADDKLIKPAYTIESQRGAPVSSRPQKNAPVQTVDMSDLPDLSAEDITDDLTFAEQELAEQGRGGERSHGRDRSERGERHERGDRHDRDGDDDRGNRRRGRRGGKRRRGGRDFDGNGGYAAEGAPQPGDDGFENIISQENDLDLPQGEGDDTGHAGADAGNRGENRREDGERGERRGRRRRGGRNRFRRGDRRERNGEPGGENSSAEGSETAAPREQREPREHRNDRAERPERTERPERSAQESRPASQDNTAPAQKPAAAVKNGVTEFVPKPVEGAEQRKGWWKRLTE